MLFSTRTTRSCRILFIWAVQTTDRVQYLASLDQQVKFLSLLSLLGHAWAPFSVFSGQIGAIVFDFAPEGSYFVGGQAR